jgi:Flp pilus assembly protein TadB
MNDLQHYVLIWAAIIGFIALAVWLVSLFGLTEKASEIAVLVVCVGAVWLFERSRNRKG